MITLQTKEAQAILALLANELFEKETDACFDGIDWRLFLRTAVEHAVAPLLYSGISKIPDADPAVFDGIERFAVRSTILFDRMAGMQSEIFDILKRERIEGAVLKGTSVAAFYPHPEVRMTGDIDILIEKKDMKRCREALLREGFSFEGSNEIHENYRKGRAAVEIHEKVTRYPDTPKGKFAQAFMMDAVKHVRVHRIGKYDFPMLEDEYHLTALLSHTERHMGASGIGLRQLCDWAVAIHAANEKRKEEIKDALDKCGLLMFARVLTGISEKYLDMPECKWLDKVDDELIDETMEEILSVGNFQAQYRKRPLASALIDPYDLEGDGKRRIFKTYLRKVDRKMRENHSWANKKTWVPVFAVVYFVKWTVSVAKGEIDGKGMINTLKTSKEREKLLRKMCLYK